MAAHPSAVAAHIRFLIDTLELATFDSVLRELRQIVECGTESSIQLLQAFAYQVNFHEGNSQIKVDLFARVVRYMMDWPNFSAIFSEAFGNLSIDEGFLRDLSKTLRLSTLEKISIGLALSDSLNLDLRIQGQNFCIVQIEELCANPFAIDSHEKVHDIITFLSQSHNFSKYVDSFKKMLSLVELNKNSCVLSPMLADDLSDTKFLRHLDLLYDSCESGCDSLLSEIEKELSVADVMKELGYGCTFDESHCQNLLSLVSPLNELTLSRVISTVVQTYTGLDDSQSMYSIFCTAIGSGSILDMSCLNSWNIDALVHSIKLLAPNINWMTVMENLDHEGFYIPDKHSFCLFMSIYERACQDPFPLHAICGSVWKNAEGQLSFLRYAVSASSETFTFAHSSRKLSVLCSQSGLNLPPANENDAWLCLDLLEVLCQLAERGHTNSVREIIEYPIQHCPGILLIGLACLSSDFNFLQHEVSFSVLPALLRDAKRNNTLQILWKLNPHLVLFGFINAHVTDPDSMINILDTCLELKILYTVLERAPFSFSIKLAVLASKREIISFEKWLNENINTYKDLFYKECFNFWREISRVFGEHEHTATTTVGKIYAESCASFLNVLKAIEQPMAQQLVNEMKQLQISSGSINSVPPEGSSEDVDAEANAYFHQMFSGQLSVDAMVQMLAHFNDFAIGREKSIFDCIIANIFDEYKFYPKYPEKQLKIAAVLFGSVIKHKLVGHLTLGVALRNVLDSLRKSVDSKMFLFGVTALEQFIDRLVEWPQYCNHILQISHLRSTWPELVNLIDRALARVSSGQLETSGANNASVDQNQVSTLQENIEASEASWQLVNNQHVPSPHQQHSKHQGLLDDKQKASAAPTNYVKPFVAPAAHPLVGTLNADTINSSQKVTTTQSLPAVPSQAGVNGPQSVPQSLGLFRSSRVLTSSGMPRQHSYNTGFGSALNIETLVAAAEKRDTPVDAPGSDIQDKIFFMINNISAANIDTKAKEFTEILKEDYYPWFAQYMVMKRASIEPNFHDLYLKFLDKVNSRSLNQDIVKATYENCKVLLRSELIKSSSEERSLLKNLGSWLGKFTIGRNQALRAREIDPKLLIIEAYEKGLMIAVIPFTSKILEPCQSSLAYQPPNPWTMGILSLLAEIYALPNLKMNLKFDIEVLFKNLGVDMKDVKPTSLLKDRQRETEGNPDFSNKDLGVTQPNAANDGNAGVISALNQVDLQPDITNSVLSSGHANALSQYNNASIHLSSSSLGEDEKIGPLNLPERLPSGHGLSAVSPSQPSYQVGQLATAIPNIGGQIVVNNKLDSLGLNGRFHRVIQVALDKSVKEIMVPIVGRSVKIAMNTTMELVLKDFAMESDENRVYNAARLMVASLAGSLAHVTCKELLRTALTANIKSLLQSMNANGELEQAIQLMTNDNLDLGCALIEQSATEKAMQTIDGEMAPQLSQRRKLREGVGSQFYDAATYTQGPFARVPEALRPKPGRLSIAQQRVYEDFIRFPWQNQSAQNSSIMPSGVSGQSASSTNPGLARVYTSSGQLNAVVYPAAQGAQGFGAVAQQIDFIPEEIDHGSSMMSSTSLIGTSEVGLQHAVDVNATNPPFTSAVMPVELRPVETSSVAHELGTFMSSSAPSDRSVISVAEPSLSTGDALDKYLIVVERLDSLIAKDATDTDIQGVIAELPEILLRCNGRDEAALAVAQRVFQRLYENASNSVHVTSYISLLVAIRDVCKLVVKELTNWVIYSNEERKLNKDITIGLIRSELLNLAELDVHLAKLVDGGRNKAATDFAISLVKTLVLQEPTVSASELYNIIDALTKLAMRPGSPESLQQLVEIAKNPSASSNTLASLNIGKDDKLRQSKDKKVPSGSSVTNRDDFNSTEGMVADPTGFRDQVSAIFNDWCQICEHPAASDAARLHLISQIHQSGLLKGDDMTDRFFRILMELSLALCLSTAEVINSGILAFNTSQQVQFSFMAIDMFEKLIVSVLKFCVVEQASAKTSFLSKILGVMTRVIQKDADEKKSSFNPRPHFRLFVYLLLDLNSSDPVFDGSNFLILTSFANAFHALQPLRVPSFSFAWLELISHRSFLPKLLMSPAQKGWPFVQRLLIDLFKFMEPYLRSAELGESVQHLYRGTLRVLLVLLHDFPEFLCDYHFSFCDVIPASCIQMRNVILSAFPHNMRLPDPSTPNLKIDLLAEIGQSPNILSEVDAALKAKQLKPEIDDYLKTRQGSSLMADLKQRLLLPQNESAIAGTRYNVPLINSLVLYVGMQAIQQMQNKSPPPSQMSHALPMDLFLASAAMDVYKSLIRDLDAEGRYLVLNAIANQLRYPNNHTHYFSFVLLFLFAEANQDVIQEQITRVLFERLIVNRPHPWGLLITFIELIKNPRYDFWSRPFTRCTPEIQSLFENVSRSCDGSKAMDDGMVSGGI